MNTFRRHQLDKWDRRFLSLAETVGGWSKGPRKHIGAVIVRPDRSVASLGYNGPPRGYDDEAFLNMTRDEQHNVVIHAEHNALIQAHSRELMAGHTLYVSPLFPCKGCAQMIADKGIARVVSYCGEISNDWMKSAQLAHALLVEAGVICVYVTD